MPASFLFILPGVLEFPTFLIFLGFLGFILRISAEVIPRVIFPVVLFVFSIVITPGIL